MSKEREQIPAPLSLEAVIQAAVETVLINGRHAPTLIVEGSNTIIRVELTQTPATAEGRQVQMLTVGALLREQGQLGTLKQLFHISETWLSIQDKAQTTRPRPFKDINRKEVLVISQFHPHDQATEVVVLEMRRDRQGELRELKPFALSDDIDFSYSPLLQAFVDGYRFGE